MTPRAHRPPESKCGYPGVQSSLHRHTQAGDMARWQWLGEERVASWMDGSVQSVWVRPDQGEVSGDKEGR